MKSPENTIKAALSAYRYNDVNQWFALRRYGFSIKAASNTTSIVEGFGRRLYIARYRNGLITVEHANK